MRSSPRANGRAGAPPSMPRELIYRSSHDLHCGLWHQGRKRLWARRSRRSTACWHSRESTMSKYQRNAVPRPNGLRGGVCCDAKVLRDCCLTPHILSGGNGSYPTAGLARKRTSKCGVSLGNLSRREIRAGLVRTQTRLGVLERPPAPKTPSKGFDEVSPCCATHSISLLPCVPC